MIKIESYTPKLKFLRRDQLETNIIYRSIEDGCENSRYVLGEGNGLFYFLEGTFGLVTREIKGAVFEEVNDERIVISNE